MKKTNKQVVFNHYIPQTGTEVVTVKMAEGWYNVKHTDGRIEVWKFCKKTGYTLTKIYPPITPEQASKMRKKLLN